MTPKNQFLTLEEAKAQEKYYTNVEFLADTFGSSNNLKAYMEKNEIPQENYNKFVAGELDFESAFHCYVAGHLMTARIGMIDFGKQSEDA